MYMQLFLGGFYAFSLGQLSKAAKDQWAEALSFVTVLKKDQERLRRHIEEGWQHRRSRNCTDP